MGKNTTFRTGLTLGSVIGTLFVLLVIGLLIAWALGWVTFGITDTEREDRVEVRMGVDKREVKEDTQQVRSRIKELRESASAAAELKSVRGTITAVKDDQLSIERDDEDRPRQFVLDNRTVVKAEGGDREIRHDALREGQQVIVTYREVRGDKVAVTVRVEDEQTSTSAAGETDGQRF